MKFHIWISYYNLFIHSCFG